MDEGKALFEVVGDLRRGEVMRINLDRYQLSEFEYSEISKMLASLNGPLDLGSLWALMDQVWVEVGCAAQPLRLECLEQAHAQLVPKQSLDANLRRLRLGRRFLIRLLERAAVGVAWLATLVASLLLFFTLLPLLIFINRSYFREPKIPIFTTYFDFIRVHAYFVNRFK